MRFWHEFKSFALRGNVIDLAIAVVIGAAFNKIVSALVDGIIMPLLSILLNEIDIADKSLIFGAVTIKCGLFLQSVLDFTIISFAIFLVVKVVNSLKKQNLVPTMPANPKQESLLIEIRDLLKKSLAEQKQV